MRWKGRGERSREDLERGRRGSFCLLYWKIVVRGEEGGDEFDCGEWGLRRAVFMRVLLGFEMRWDEMR